MTKIWYLFGLAWRRLALYHCDTFCLVLAQKLLFRSLDVLVTLHAHSGFTLSSETYTTSDVTRLIWRAKMAGHSTGRLRAAKKRFPRSLSEKKFTVCVSKVQSLLLCRDLRYENFCAEFILFTL